eukprot:5383055-Prymnesium_polylepis.2
MPLPDEINSRAPQSRVAGTRGVRVSTQCMSYAKEWSLTAESYDSGCDWHGGFHSPPGGPLVANVAASSMTWIAKAAKRCTMECEYTSKFVAGPRLSKSGTRVFE